MKSPTTAPGRPDTSLGIRTAWALLAGAGLLALLGGVPLLLTAMTGWPPALPTGTELDYPRLHAATIARKTLGLVGWIVWAWLIMALIRDLVHAWRWGLRPETVRDAASPARWLALTLIGAITALWPGAAANAAPAPVPEPVTTGVAVNEPVAASPDSRLVAQQLAWRASNATVPVASAQQVDTDQTEDLGQGTSVRVEKGDTLSHLAAAHYGDERQWPRIWEANRDRVFDDGQRFTDPDKIHPGWELRIPEAATDNAPSEQDATATPPAGSVFHTVTAKDTLSGLAAQYLGDADRYMELFNANQGRTFADGRQLSDPDLIVDGWILVIPIADATESHHPETEDPNDSSPSPDNGAPPETDTTTPGAVPGPGNDGVVTPDHDPAPNPPDDPSQPEPATDETGKAIDTPDTEAPKARLPLGVWLSAGTCLAAGTVVSIALRARRRRPAAPAPAAEEPLTGRLSDLEAIIEAENHKLLDATTEPPAPVAVDQTREPVDLHALAANGVGLLGPGQHAAARAAIIAAAAGEAHVHITAAADLRLDLADAERPASVRIGDQLVNVLAQTETRGGDIAIVCTDTDLDETTRPLLDRFLARDGHGAIILGDWEPATVRLDGTGNVLDARGRAADLDLDLLHIAEAATAAALLAQLCEPAAAPPPSPTTAAPSPAAHEPTDMPPTTPSAKTTPGAPEDGPEQPDTDTADAPEPVTRLRLCLFGPPNVYLGETPIALKKGKRARTLLAVLALADGPIPRTELLDAVVGDQDPANARNNLNTIGSTTRRNLQDATGTAAPFYRYDDATGYQLDTARFSTDVADFDAAEQAAALSTDPAEATAHLSRLTALYTGDLAEGIDTPTIRALREQYRAATARASRKLADLIETHDPARAHHHRQRAATLESTSPALHQASRTGQPATEAPAPTAGARRTISSQAPRPAPHQPNH